MVLGQYPPTAMLVSSTSGKIAFNSGALSAATDGHPLAHLTNCGVLPIEWLPCFKFQPFSPGLPWSRQTESPIRPVHIGDCVLYMNLKTEFNTVGFPSGIRSIPTAPIFLMRGLGEKNVVDSFSTMLRREKSNRA